MAAGCSAEYEGDVYPQVVTPREVKTNCDTVPEGARVIGVTTEFSQASVDADSFLQAALWCSVDRRLIRRMRRTASEVGGEFLVDVRCEIVEDEEQPTTVFSDEEATLECETRCVAEVARRWSHDRE